MEESVDVISLNPREFDIRHLPMNTCWFHSFRCSYLFARHDNIRGLFIVKYRWRIPLW